jgi:hypothetical protein
VFAPEGLYLNTAPGDCASVWRQPLDGKSLACSRGPPTGDAFLVKGFRQ